MKKIKLTNPLKTRRVYLTLVFCIPLAFVMCHEHEKKVERDSLNSQISNLDREISETRDLRTARVPDHLRNTQSRYLNASDSLNNKSDSIGTYMMQNEDLLLVAFNNYATRIGRDFQISKFLSVNDITTLRSFIAQLDSMDYLQEMARTRILQEHGSLNDLSYFLEMLDFDSINAKLENKLAWNFYPDSTSSDEEPIEISVLNFESQNVNDALRTEQNLLNRAWRKNTLQEELNANDSLRIHDIANVTDSGDLRYINAKYDSLQTQLIANFDDMDEYTPNFSIPEFDSIHVQYMHKDSIINEYYKTYDGMIRAEDSLEQYRQSMMHKRDSLVTRLNELEK